MESSDPMETSSGLKLDEAADQNAGLVTFVHIMIGIMIVGLIVAYAVDKA
jgi:hypothetical protein